MVTLLRSAYHGAFAALIIGIVNLGFSPAVSSAEVNIYSARQEALIKPLLDKFTTET
ncbi:MAG: iron(III) transport system substrate-binding protein, partial [Cryomorphaceae bacterium]